MRARSTVGALSVFLTLSLAAQQDIDVARGFKPGQSFQGAASIDAVNLFNGTVNVTIPLSQEYRAGALSYAFRIRGASGSWDVGHHEVDDPIEPKEYAYTYPWKHANAGLSWFLSLGKIAIIDDPESEYDLVYVGPDGTQHNS